MNIKCRGEMIVWSLTFYCYLKGLQERGELSNSVKYWDLIGKAKWN